MESGGDTWCLIDEGLEVLEVFLKRALFNLDLIRAGCERGDCIVAGMIGRRSSNLSGGNTRHGYGGAGDHGLVRIVDRASQGAAMRLRREQQRKDDQEEGSKLRLQNFSAPRSRFWTVRVFARP